MALQLICVDVSYSQLGIFWSFLQHPFNNWTKKHVDQGFAWRPGSVSFRTLVDSGMHSISVTATGNAAPLSQEAIRAFAVPFEVPTDGVVEIGSIADSVQVVVPTGRYSLRCEFLGPDGQGKQQVNIAFANQDLPAFEILRLDDELVVDGELLTTAQAAVS